MPDPTPTVDLDEALICAYSILSLLHHRGIVNSEWNREDIAKALDKLEPFSLAARRRVMDAHNA